MRTHDRLIRMRPGWRSAAMVPPWSVCLPRPGLMKIPEEQASHMIGVTEVTYIPGRHPLAVVDSTLADLDDHVGCGRVHLAGPTKEKGTRKNMARTRGTSVSKMYWA